MRVLFIGPLPDPVTGHSLACQRFLDELTKSHEVDVINLSRDNLRSGVDSFSRVKAVLGIIWKVWRRQKRAQFIYLTISESVTGNLKDLFIYFVCLRKLYRMVIHLHGGSLKKLLFDKHKLLFKINRFFIGRLGGVIVLGPTHVGIFSGLISPKKIHIVSNFSSDDLLTTQEEIFVKFRASQLLRILFLSNFIEGKGFGEIVDAYLRLDEDLKKRVFIDFAGAFESNRQKIEFLSRIEGLSQIHYHGIVQGTKKKELLSRAHLFCLPTSLSEGQPISILEAYASGCAVIATDQGGIRDVFQDKINGFQVEAKSPESLKNTLEHCLQNTEALMPIATTNFTVAQKKYRTSHYHSALMNIVNRFEGLS